MKKNLNYLDNNGSFKLENANEYNNLYFPLANQLGLKASITPGLNGDLTIDHNHFFLTPKTEVDLNNSLFGRNVWFRINNQYHWAISGNSPYQYLNQDKVAIEAGILYHKVKRNSGDFEGEITSFITLKDNVELHRIIFKNISKDILKIKPTIAIPIYGRSAENLRDHRHVTSLLNRAYVLESGIVNRPTLSFDERGHVANNISYGVFARFDGLSTTEYYPNFDEFIGTSSLLFPDTIKNIYKKSYKVGDIVAGYEVMGALSTSEITINPNESFELKFALVIANSNQEAEEVSKKYLDGDFSFYLEETKKYWLSNLDKLKFDLRDDEFSKWLNWVRIQPVLRRIYGNSFLPHHDYGRGGRGWRDLWQDQLALILMDDDGVKENLINNFAGVRIDGSNATIIGTKSGEFIADRNKIVRVWSDHACWSLFTAKLYLDYSGDYDFLFLNQSYFKDKFSHYTKKAESLESWNNKQLDHYNQVYHGSILEHLIIQNVIPFFNVGKHGMIRLEDADWNDGLDMASEFGETVAFTAFYAMNLKTLCAVLKVIEDSGTVEVSLLEELKVLLIYNIETSNKEKKSLLNEYFDSVQKNVTGRKFDISISKLKETLENMGNYLFNKIRIQEWKTYFDQSYDDGQLSYFNGYYDNSSYPIDDPKNKVMELTGQVFTILSGASTNEMVKAQIKAADELLFDSNVGGYRLNTNFNDLKTNFGRLFGFAYGTKENGAMFSHMAVMYAYALLDRGYVDAGLKALKSIYGAATKIDKSNIYPGIPEYFNPEGRGMYHYLTGSASWLILTFVTQVFGIKGIHDNDDSLIIDFEPKLSKDLFNKKIATIEKIIRNKIIKITYVNDNDLDYNEYKVSSIFVDGNKVEFVTTNNRVRLILLETPKHDIKISLN